MNLIYVMRTIKRALTDNVRLKKGLYLQKFFYDSESEEFALVAKDREGTQVCEVVTLEDLEPLFRTIYVSSRQEDSQNLHDIIENFDFGQYTIKKE